MTSDAAPRRAHHQLAVVAALTANAVVAAAKLVGFVFTGSASLLAETFHSTADTGNQGLLLLGETRARRDADREHPFGHARERYFWSFVVATMLFTLGSLVSLIEGIEKLRSPHEVGSYVWAFTILGVAVVAESLSFRTATRNARRIKGSRTWWRFIRTTKNPELPVVLLEDSGALAGLAVATAGVALTAATGNPRYDALGSVGIGLLLGAVAIVLAVEMKSLLIGEAAAPRDVDAITAALCSVPGIGALHELRTEQLGPDALLVVARVGVEEGLTDHDIDDVLDGAEAAVRARVPAARFLYLRPVVGAPAPPQPQGSG